MTSHCINWLTPDFPPDPGFLTPPEPFLSVPFCKTPTIITLSRSAWLIQHHSFKQLNTK